MFCALKTLLQYFKNIKRGGGCFAPPPSDFTGEEQNNPPVLYSWKLCENVIATQNMLI